MVLYFELQLDHLGYPAKGPQIRGESGRSGPLPENLRQTLFLVSRKARGTAGMGFGAQSFYPLLLEHFFSNEKQRPRRRRPDDSLPGLLCLPGASERRSSGAFPELLHSLWAASYHPPYL